MAYFSIDGIDFTNAVVKEPERSFQILDGENAGRQLLTAKMERDVLGTFYNYTVEIDSSFMTKAEYDQLYNILSAPVDSHRIVMPFAQETLTFDAYVTAGKDKLLKIDENGNNYWHGLSIQFIAMAPERRPS